MKEEIIKEEEKFTLEDAAKELAKKQEQQQQKAQQNTEEFLKLLQEAMKKTGCTLKINPESKLNDLQIIVVPLNN